MIEHYKIQPLVHSGLDFLDHGQENLLKRILAFLKTKLTHFFKGHSILALCKNAFMLQPLLINQYRTSYKF